MLLNIENLSTVTEKKNNNNNKILFWSFLSAELIKFRTALRDEVSPTKLISLPVFVIHLLSI
jgi:hypothetical protein